ncbi:MAG: NAD(P)/FAD-dependent oxidoreductase [Chloroflexi bacterium]|nr:NAD(P)/FAD-dependent oxidoreductase [Chloroflexota bacterium]
MATYVIVGNSAGGIGAAEAIRQVDKENELVMISDEPFPAYSRPLISEFLAGETTLEKMLYRPRDFYARHNVYAVLGKKAARLSFDPKYVELEDGERIAWEKLLIATGGTPFVPKTEGSDKTGVFTFTTLKDAQAIEGKLRGARSAVVIGGGLIGISVTEALVKRGLQVSVVELKDRILNILLDEEASALAEDAVNKAGVRIITGHTVARILGHQDDDATVGGVVLDDGEVVACDIVVMAIGVVPRVELARETPIKINRGILVDRAMRTNVPDVYACGDVAEAYDFVWQSNRVTPIWPNAYIGGRVAGFNMAGIAAEYAGGTAMNSLNYFGLAIVSAGMVSPDGQASYEVLVEKRLDEGVYKKVILRDGTVVGMAFVGEIDRSGIVLGLMRDGVPVDSFKSHLTSANLNFALFPEQLRKARLGLTGLTGPATSEDQVDQEMEAVVE